MAQADELIATATPTYRLGRWLLGCHLRLACRMQVHGLEFLPPRGGVLLLANHQSFLDIPALAVAARRHVCFMARDSLARSPVLAWVMRESGVVLVRRGAPDKAALERAIAHLRAGDAVAIFPEGTRSADGALGSFRSGALLVARRAGTPIVPVGIRGTIDALPRDRKVPRLARVRVSFGAPLDPRQPEALEAAREAVRALIGDGRSPRD